MDQLIPGWIRCTETQPSDERQVLVAKQLKNGSISYGLGYYTEKLGWVCQGANNVVAWMNIPRFSNRPSL